MQALLALSFIAILCGCSDPPAQPAANPHDPKVCAVTSDGEICRTSEGLTQ
jgi:hypothetical protein